MDRIAIICALNGANFAAVAADSRRFDARYMGAISGKKSAALNLAGGEGSLADWKSVVVTSSELEHDGQRSLWATAL